MDTTDSTVKTVLELFWQGVSQKQICSRLKLSHAKVTQILVSAGAYDTEESTLFAKGYTISEIAKILDKKESSVVCRLPYRKGLYNADHPTVNAMRIRLWRSKKHNRGEAND